MLANKNLYKTNSLTVPLASNVAAFLVTSNGTVNTLLTTNVLQQSGVTVANNATYFQVRGDGTLLYLDTNGNLQQQGAAAPLDTQSAASYWPATAPFMS